MLGPATLQEEAGSRQRHAEKQVAAVRVREEVHADAVVLNGENSAGGMGITAKTARQIFAAGAALPDAAGTP